VARNPRPASGSGRGKRQPAAARPAGAGKAPTRLFALNDAGGMTDADWGQFFAVVGGLVRDAEATGQLRAWHEMRVQANARGETNNLMRFFNIYRLNV
jgi:hypothetical protein